MCFVCKINQHFHDFGRSSVKNWILSFYFLTLILPFPRKVSGGRLTSYACMEPAKTVFFVPSAAPRPGCNTLLAACGRLLLLHYSQGAKSSNTSSALVECAPQGYPALLLFLMCATNFQSKICIAILDVQYFRLAHYVSVFSK